MPSRRILLINHEYPPLGGVGGNATRHIARGLAKLGHKPYVLTTAWPGLPALEERDGVVIKRIVSRRADMRSLGAGEGARFIANAMWIAQGLARQWKIDITVPFFTLPAAPVALFLKRRRFIPYVLALQPGDVPRRRPRHAWTTEAQVHRGVRHLWHCASAVIAPSQNLADTARGFAPAQAVDVIPYGADVDGITPKDDYQSKGDVKLLYVGRLEKDRGLDVLLPALAKVSSALKWKLALVGDGPEWPVIAALAARFAMIDRIELAGWQGWNTLPPIYRGADVFVLPSRVDGMPAALLEAMASGLPVVSTCVAGVSEAVLDRQTGMLVPPDDSDAFADALTELLVDPTRWEPMGRAGRARVETYYSWTNVAEKWVAVIERVLAS